MAKYSENDAAKDTDASSREASKAWHQARDDAASSGELEERNENKVSDSETGKELYGIFKEAGMTGGKKGS
jgi:hypothetical protein